MVLSLEQAFRFFESFLKNGFNHLSSVDYNSFAWFQMAIEEDKACIIYFESNHNRPFIFSKTSGTTFNLTQIEFFNPLQYFPFSKQANVAPSHFLTLVERKGFFAIHHLSKLINPV